MPGQQKSLTGTVVSDKMDKTVVVLVETTTRHRLYRKILKRSKRYLAHDDRLQAKPGDLVRILETRPLSRHKRWRVTEILQRGEVIEIAPQEIDSEYLGRPRERAAEPPVEPSAAEAPVAEAEEAGPAEEPAAEAAPETAAEAPAAELTVEEQAEAEEAAPAEEPAAEAAPETAAEAPAVEPEEEPAEEQATAPAEAEEPAAAEEAEEQEKP
jgi:small subunit ribosomal protein S17